MTMFPVELVNRLQQSRVVAGFSVANAEDAVAVAQALLDGGIDAIELTLRTDAGIKATRLIRDSVPGILLGVGTILNPEQARAVKEAGADFGVSPGCNVRVVRAARQVALPFAPGICTPTDLEAAIEEGCRLVKFFPAAASGGLSFLKSMAAPYRHLGIKYFPLGGINADNMMDYLNEDIVCAVGGSWIVSDELVKNKEWKSISERAAEVVSRIKDRH